MTETTWCWNALDTALEAASLSNCSSQQMRSWKGQANEQPTKTARQIGCWLEKNGWELESRLNDNNEWEERWTRL